MPLSESEEIETNPIFNAAFVQVSQNINDSFPDENNRRFFKALVTGGKTMANLVVARCQGIKEISDDIDEEKALGLTKLFTLAMLSQTFRWIDNQGPETEAVEKANLSAVSIVLKLFNDSSEDSIKDFMNIDSQLKYELKHHEHLVHLAVLLLAKACEIYGHKCIEWSKVSFPYKSLLLLTSSGAIVDAPKINNVKDIQAVISGFDSGLQAMIKYHEEHSES